MPDRAMFIPSGFKFNVGDSIRDTNGRVGVVVKVIDGNNIVVRWPKTISED